MATLVARVTIDMPARLVDRLDLAARAQSLSRAKLIREIIENWIDLAEEKANGNVS